MALDRGTLLGLAGPVSTRMPRQLSALFDDLVQRARHASCKQGEVDQSGKAFAVEIIKNAQCPEGSLITELAAIKPIELISFGRFGTAEDSGTSQARRFFSLIRRFSC